jgi:hypothetical protein
MSRAGRSRGARAAASAQLSADDDLSAPDVFDNCRLTAQAHHQHPFDLFNAAARCAESTKLAHRAIEQAG